MSTPKKKLWPFIVLIIIVIGLGVWIASFVVASEASGNPTAPSPYEAVYLSTGDIYYGRLSWFPTPHLTNVWLLQKGNGTNQAEFGMTPFTSAFWGPIDEIYLNPNQIIFWTYLRNNSQVAQALSNPALLQQLLSGSQQPETQPLSPSSGTSTFKGPSTPPPGGK